MATRRQFIKMTFGSALTLLLPRVTHAAMPEDRNRFLLVILRGGLDGLAAAPAWGDKHYRSVRESLALDPPGKPGGVLDLDGFFGLHPSLANLHESFRGHELTLFHGVAPPYADRSHFDAQNVLESGVETPNAAKDGWLYRAFAGERDFEERAIAIGPSVPLVLRGAITASNWAPDRLPDPNDDTMARILSLYSQDPVLGPRIAAMMETEEMLTDMAMSRSGRSGALSQLSEATTRFLGAIDGPSVAVLEVGGWDTHANQGASTGALSTRLALLDRALGDIRKGLGAIWNKTAILVVTEFGRTVAVNGTRGTDHGVGGAAFLLGGAVNGGKVITDWQGLSRGNLFEGRDLPPVIDQRQLFKSVLQDHLNLPGNTIENRVFPDSAGAQRLGGLFRA